MTNKELGELSEKIAYLHEIARLGLQKGTYLVKLVSDNTKLGYDIESIKDFDSKEPIFIEVKTLNSDKSFIVT